MAGVEGKVRAVDSGAVGSSAAALGPRKTVQCVCGHRLFDGIVIRSRVVRMLARGGAEALCRCKRWQAVPVTYDDRQLAIASASTLPGGVAKLGHTA
jgi:hypothetical protein